MDGNLQFLLGLKPEESLEELVERDFLGDRHVERGLQCAVCHGDQVSGKLPEDRDRHEHCVKCYGFYDQVAKKIQPANPEEMNPHSQHDGNLPCTTCHQGHKQSVNYCAQCHYYNFKVP